MCTFDYVKKNIKNGVYLWGAGANGIWVLDFCHDNGINVVGFIDSDTKKHGKIFGGVECISYHEYKERNDNKLVLVVTKHFVNDVLEEHSDDEHFYAFDAWLAQKYDADYRKLVFEDEKSYRTLDAVLACMKNISVKELYDVAEGKQYFCISPFWGKNNETFVDLGAYTGETAEQFINSVGGSFKKIYAFEPSEKQFNAMQIRKKRLCEEWAIEPEKIVTEKCCVGNVNGYLCFDNSTVSTNNRISENGSEQVRSVTIDSYFADKDITFLKADIEGAELEMLKNGEQVIRRCRPKLAICVYHRPDDLLNIYRFVNELGLGYKFKLRHHSCEVTETVLYCYI